MGVLSVYSDRVCVLPSFLSSFRYIIRNSSFTPVDFPKIFIICPHCAPPIVDFVQLRPQFCPRLFSDVKVAVAFGQSDCRNMEFEYSNHYVDLIRSIWCWYMCLFIRFIICQAVKSYSNLCGKKIVEARQLRIWDHPFRGYILVSCMLDSIYIQIMVYIWGMRRCFSCFLR